jgi:hypothetical protein
MAQQTVNIGSAANDGTGTPLRDAFDMLNDNFNEAYQALAPRNVCINGDLDVWQLGTTFTAAHQAITADRFIFGQDGGTPSTTAVWAVTRDTDTPDVTIPYSLKIACTTADASVAAGEESHIRYGVEGYDFVPFKGTTGTLAFWVKSSKTGTHCVAFVNSGRDRTYVAEYTVTSADTWEFKTITVTFDASGGTWDYTTGLGIGIRFCLRVGSTYQGTTDTWNSANCVGSASQVNLADANTNVIRFARISFTRTSTYIAPQRETMAAKITACQRYLRVFGCSTGGVNFNALASTANAANVDFPVSTPMRVAPTISMQGTIGTDYDATTYAAVDIGITGVTSYARSPMWVKCTLDKTGGFTAGTLYQFRLKTTSAALVASAEIL